MKKNITRLHAHSSHPLHSLFPAGIRRAIAGAALAAAGALSLAPAAHADDGQSSLWQATKDHVANIWDQGDNAIYLSGVAHHGRSTYTKEKLNELNEHAWGLGYGRTLRNGRGDDESLYGFVVKDSHRHPQYMAGYAYEWVFPVARTGLELGLGGTAMLMSRQDYLNSVPFPVPLPLASIGTKKGKVMFAYVPRLSGNKNNGDVLLIFGRIEM